MIRQTHFVRQNVVSDGHMRFIKNRHVYILAHKVLLQRNLLSELHLVSLWAKLFVELLCFVDPPVQNHIPSGGSKVFLISSLEIVSEKIGVAIFNLEPLWDASG